MATSNLKPNRYWPPITDIETARRVARQAFWVAMFVAGMTAVLATLAVSGKPLIGVGAGAFLDAAIFAAIAWGIWRMSRTAAVLGLVLFVLERVLTWQNSARPSGFIVAIFLALGFANGVRATFAYHKMMATRASTVNTDPISPK